ncbi:MAG: biotin--[acetyl-CoA-carboxylase] ligase [Bdellovibrionales bacterium]
MDYPVYHFPEIDSTNAEARRIVESCAGRAAVIKADTQTAGRGRREREWASPVGNIYCSVLHPLEGDLRDVGLQAYIYGLAIARAANGLLPESNAKVKWPNDVLVNNRKLAGVLLETAECPSTKTMYLIAGFGVNVAMTPPAAAGAAYPPTSMVDEGARCTADAMLADILSELKLLHGIYGRSGFAGIRPLWCELAHGISENITVTLPDHSRLQGIFKDLAADGALILESEGTEHAITAGDVFFMRKHG